MNGDMRFDADTRVEIWVTADNLADHPEFERIVESGRNETERIAALRALALVVAHERIAGINALGLGVEITAEFGMEAVNVERIDWTALAKTKAQVLAEEAEDEARFDRLVKEART